MLLVKIAFKVNAAENCSKMAWLLMKDRKKLQHTSDLFPSLFLTSPQIARHGILGVQFDSFFLGEPQYSQPGIPQMFAAHPVSTKMHTPEMLSGNSVSNKQ